MEKASEIVHAFLSAQRLDLRKTEDLAVGATVIWADDDHSLVNTFLVVDGGSSDKSTSELRSAIQGGRVDPSRTELLVGDGCSSDDIRSIADACSGLRRTSQLRDFLDAHVRPQRVCARLDAKDPESTSPVGSLLYEADFVEPWATSPESGQVPALHHLFTGWATGNAARLSMLIAPAGYGKSKLTHILAKRLARNYMASKGSVVRPPIPFLIPFGQYQRSTSFTGLIMAALEKDGVPRLTAESFRLLVGLGRILFILDGYDEMLETNPETARQNIAEFVANSGRDSRILLTSRSLFYRTSNDLLGELGDPLLDESEVDLLELLPFDLTQAKEYLGRRLRSAHDRTRKLERAQSLLDAQSMEILGSPFFLSEFARVVDSEKWTVADVRKRGSLEFLISSAFDRERGRQSHQYSDSVQRAFLEAIAFDMLRTGTAGYSLDDLSVFAFEAAPDLFEGEGQKLLRHHFLLPDDPRSINPMATMRHQVWRDHFQGTALAAACGSGNSQAFDVIQTRDLPEGVLRAATHRLSADGRSQLELWAPRLNHFGVRNALRITAYGGESGAPARRLPKWLATRLFGRDLGDLSLHSLDFGTADLSGASLAGSYFQNCDLTRCRLEAAVISRTTFAECALDDSLLGSDFSSAWVDGVQYFGPQIEVLFGIENDEEGASRLEEIEREFRNYSLAILRERLSKFVKPRGIDASISWTAFMGGTAPRDREFIVRRVYRALRSESIVTEATSAAGSRPPVCLSPAADVRHEVLDFVQDGEPGPMLKRVLSRLER